MKKTVVWVAALVLTSLSVAQQSDNYRLSDHVVNAGGHPDSGVVIESAGYRISLDSIGPAVVGDTLSSASYHVDSSFAACFPPPGEVLGLLFSDKETLVWNSERSVGTYNLYRGLLSNLSSLQYGACEQQDLASETATDAAPVPEGDGFSYLATAKNRLDEEGTKGYDSDHAERQGSACP